MLNPLVKLKHVAIIMDGNGRWAKQRGKMRTAGHRAGARSVREVVTAAAQADVDVLTLFAFSCENWQRPDDEVSMLMELFYFTLEREAKKLHKNNIRLKIIGDKSQFSSRLQNKIIEVERLTEQNSGLLVNIAANYSGQWDIVQTCRYLAQQVAEKQLTIDSIDQSCFSEAISLAGIPAVDLMIRTSGEFRISNFMLWQLAYAELYFTDKLWPDFRRDDFNDALAWYHARDRRFGAL